MSDSAMTAVELKNQHPDLLQNIATRTIRHRLQKDLGLPSRVLQEAHDHSSNEEEKA